MSGAGASLAMARPALAPIAPLAAALAAWDDQFGLEWLGKPLGLSAALLERIAAGEVEPEPEIAAGLWRELGRADAEAACGGAASAGGAAVCEAAAPPSFALARSAGGHRVAMALGEVVHLIELDAARAAHAELGELLALIDDPERFER